MRTEIVFDVECGDFWIYLNGEVEGFANSRSEAETKAAELVARFERHAREHAWQVATAQANTAQAAHEYTQIRPYSLKAAA